MKLKFIEVQFTELIKKNKYIIIPRDEFNPDSIPLCIGTFNDYIMMTTRYYTEHAHFTRVFKLNSDVLKEGNILLDYSKKKQNLYTGPLSYCKYYTLYPQKQKIQEALEKRATNSLLQRITGDDTFEY